MPIKNKELDSAMNNRWLIGICDAPCKEPMQFCFGFCCPCIAALFQRQELLKITGEPYVCCGGMFPCGPLGKPCDENLIYCECCCCPFCMINGNRFMVQTRFMVANGPCDEFILTFMCIISWAICILETAGIDVPDELEAAVDLLMDIIFAAMHAQQHHQIEAIKEQGYTQPPPQVIMLLPPKQQEIIQMGKPSGPGGMGAPPQMMGVPQQQGMQQRPSSMQQQQFGMQQQQFGMQQQQFGMQQQQVGMQQQQPMYVQGPNGQLMMMQQQPMQQPMAFQGQQPVMMQPVMYQQPAPGYK